MVPSDIMNNEMTEAVIYLKDGNRKYGMLINNDTDDAYYFISNSDLNVFQETKNEQFIEIVSESLIEAIDVDLK